MNKNNSFSLALAAFMTLFAVPLFARDSIAPEHHSNIALPPTVVTAMKKPGMVSLHKKRAVHHKAMAEYHKSLAAKYEKTAEEYEKMTKQPSGEMRK